MSDLIRREDVLIACIEEAHKARRYQCGQIWELDYYEIKEAINSIPTAEPKVGKWFDHSNEGYVQCPFCGSLTTCEDNIDELHYCFNCGAKMKGEK